MKIDKVRFNTTDEGAKLGVECRSVKEIQGNYNWWVRNITTAIPVKLSHGLDPET